MVKNKLFDKVYNKVVKKFSDEVYIIMIKGKYGGSIDYSKLKTMNTIIFYLNTVKDSQYTYYHVAGLTEIYNYINKL